MSCTNTGPFDGGTYNNPYVTDPQVTGGSFQNASVSGPVTLDSAAAASILSAVQELDPVLVTDDPKSSEGEALPETIIGEDRSALLGKPAGFIKLGGYMVPVYRAQ